MKKSNYVIEEKLVVTIYILIFVAQAFNGALKYYLSNLGIIYVYYLPIILAIFYLFLSVGRDIVRMKTPKVFAITILIFFFGNFVAVIYLSSLPQILFGNYLYLLLFFGLRTHQIFLNNLDVFLKLFNGLFKAILLGIILNYFYQYPWEGHEYSVGSVEIESSRAVTTYGIRRLAGFGASSYHSAAILLVFFSFQLVFNKRKLYHFINGLLAFFVIVISTSKGVLLAFIVITCVVVLRKFLLDFLLKVCIATVILVGGILPFSTIFYDYNQISYGSNIIYAILFNSFKERLIRIWPDALHLIEDHGNILIGRGFGSIGMSQKLFEPALYCPGDNLWLYIYGNLGLIGLFSIVLFYLRMMFKLRIRNGQTEFLTFIFFLGHFTYGITFVTMQQTLFVLLTGVFTGVLYSISKCRSI